ncbi:putative restriction endonuclease [Salegentibacter echinorum]|uniref:Putative restriction endonuclease n=1 Tax=Salegentibacter echinorum TaxID=1073325 RepID=A0A1M5GWY8_SALEC|nr:HNH endonuclease [Salegentibacter echinorum]SHG08125.1 putative restriction endonuclease [Salegentibacter echinorum]
MSEEIIYKYSNYFQKLNRGFSKNLGRAPHKPILLLSIIQLIAKGVIKSNRIFITSEIILAFKQNWEDLVHTGHSRNFSLPFFHLRSEPFWHLSPKPGKQIETTRSKSIKSFNNLNESIAFAEIDKELFLLLQKSENQLWFEQILIESYFPDFKVTYLRPDSYYEEAKIESEILNEPREFYQNNIKQLRQSLEENEFEEEIFVRGGLFKRTIPKIYDYTCCISGLKINSAHNIQMVDACHIHPFSISNDDTVSNGISLSPTLHRAFDRGLITITQNFIVRISPTIEEKESSFPLFNFEDKQIQLPKKYEWYPSQEALKWHNKEVFLL